MTLRELVCRVWFEGDDARLMEFDHKVTRLSENLTRLGKVMTVGVTTPLLGLGIASVKAASEVEQLDMAFGVMVGDAEKGSKLVRDLYEFAAKTPFQIQEIGAVGKQLLAMGSTAEGLIDDLKMMGDVAAGVGVPLWRIALNFGQVRAQGKLTGRELRDFAIAGVPLISELAKMFGKSATEIQEMVARGQIGLKEVEAVFRIMTSEGGKFANMMTKQATTLTGVWSNFLDNTYRVRTEFGKVIVKSLDLKGALLKLNDVLWKLLDWFQKLSPSTQRFIIVFSGLVALIGPAAFAFSGLIRLIQTLGLTLWGTAAPLVLVSALLALLLEDFLVWQRGGKSVLGMMLGAYEDWVEAAKDVFKGFADWLGALFTGKWDEVLEGLRVTLSAIKIMIDDFIQGMQGKITAEHMEDIRKRPWKYPISAPAVFLGELVGRRGITRLPGVERTVAQGYYSHYGYSAVPGMQPSDVIVNVNIPMGVTDPEGIARAAGDAVRRALSDEARGMKARAPVMER